MLMPTRSGCSFEVAHGPWNRCRRAESAKSMEIMNAVAVTPGHMALRKGEREISDTTRERLRNDQWELATPGEEPGLLIGTQPVLVRGIGHHHIDALRRKVQCGGTHNLGGMAGIAKRIHDQARGDITKKSLQPRHAFRHYHGPADNRPAKAHDQTAQVRA